MNNNILDYGAVADGVTLDNVKISGSLEGVDTSFETVGCSELYKNDCNF